MHCIEATKGQKCSCCGKQFKGGEVIFDHHVGLLCGDSCGLTKDLGERRQAPSERGVVIVGGRRPGKSVVEKVLREQAQRAEKGLKPIEIVDDPLRDVMGDKLAKHINELGRRAKK